ncbi:hypothetical protein DFH07DRAFT_967071 [Mycena maculata]|uniref:C2H2-type domain-containing protein n=1 Tax=Mycena maculata TaxID=230809 RepID=A0AAD7I6V8_9AGAR|nr:hypothetical protein DFH07DRAFT_967071 [Mycena maculata]
MASSDLFCIPSFEPALDEAAFRTSILSDFDVSDIMASLDETLFSGSIFEDTYARHAVVHTVDAAPPALPFAGCDLSAESVESIFDALHVSCASVHSTDPLAPVPRPFIPYEPPEAEAQASLPSSPVYTVFPATDRLALDYAAKSFVAARVAAAAHEDDESEDESDESDEDDEDADPDFKAIAVPRAPPRAVRPLPGRVMSKASPAAPPLPSRRVPAPSSSSTSGSASNSRKRKPTRAAGPRATKKAAVRSVTDAPAPLPLVANHSASPNTSGTYAGVPEQYHHLIDMGCTLSGHGMACNIRGCTRRTGNLADMTRHIVVHFPDRQKCKGCPVTYARVDALKRHVVTKNKHNDGHFSVERQVFMKKFLALPVVRKMQADCAPDNISQCALCKELKPMFETLLLSSTTK